MFLKNKLKHYKEELIGYAAEGLDIVHLMENQDALEIKRQELSQTDDGSEIKKILEILIAPLIESK
jgi:hypothetical protein